MKEPVLICWSGGKDSALALRAVLAGGQIEPIGLMTTLTEGYDRISMHGVRRELLEAQAVALNLPLHKVYISQNATNAEYEAKTQAALLEFKRQGIRRVVFGDLFLQDIRAYRDRLLGKIGMEALYPVWGRDTTALAREFIAQGFQAILVCGNPQRLDRRFAGRCFDAALLAELPASVDPCGENGEFHTWVFASPDFANGPIPHAKGQVIERQGFCFCDVLPLDLGKQTDPRPAQEKRCPRCGTTFTCGPATGKTHCWCSELPNVGPVASSAHDCLCPDCLRAAVATKLLKSDGESEKGSQRMAD